MADTAEPIASHRPYRGARGLDVAIDELEAARAVTLDRDAVDACVRLLRSGEFRFDADV